MMHGAYVLLMACSMYQAAGLEAKFRRASSGGSYREGDFQQPLDAWKASELRLIPYTRAKHRLDGAVYAASSDIMRQVVIAAGRKLTNISLALLTTDADMQAAVQDYRLQNRLHDSGSSFGGNARRQALPEGSLNLIGAQSAFDEVLKLRDSATQSGDLGAKDLAPDHLPEVPEETLPSSLTAMLEAAVKRLLPDCVIAVREEQIETPPTAEELQLLERVKRQGMKVTVTPSHRMRQALTIDWSK